MVLPLYDDNTDRRTTPVVTWSLIALNVLVFLVPQRLGENDRFTYAYALVPQEIATGRDVVTPDTGRQHPVTGEPMPAPGLRETPLPVYFTLLTSMFLHGGLAHLLGNMLFLWIFGDNVEDRLGHGRYLLFYLVCGVFAGLAHVGATYLFRMDPLVPCVGASGAISGVLGGYIFLFPQKRVTVILFRILTQVPAWVAIGMWFVFQLISSLGAFGDSSQVGGVAYGAHIGGFLAGLILVFLFTAADKEDSPPPRRPSAPWQRW
jgi:membrane associated rhomboid family serine protease